MIHWINLVSFLVTAIACFFVFYYAKKANKETLEFMRERAQSETETFRMIYDHNQRILELEQSLSQIRLHFSLNLQKK
jgi:hypothetical protein